MLESVAPYYAWIKAAHVISVIAWMAGLFYLPRLFVYHAERAKAGSELDATFQVMEHKLLKVIMTPAMVAILGMTAVHVWLGQRVKDFAGQANAYSGKTYRLVNEVPTVLMFAIVIAVIVRPFG